MFPFSQRTFSSFYPLAYPNFHNRQLRSRKKFAVKPEQSSYRCAMEIENLVKYHGVGKREGRGVERGREGGGRSEEGQEEGARKGRRKERGGAGGRGEEGQEEGERRGR
jgi:hypothetical protein